MEEAKSIELATFDNGKYPPDTKKDSPGTGTDLHQAESKLRAPDPSVHLKEERSPSSKNLTLALGAAFSTAGPQPRAMDEAKSMEFATVDIGKDPPDTDTDPQQAKSKLRAPDPSVR